MAKRGIFRQREHSYAQGFFSSAAKLLLSFTLAGALLGAVVALGIAIGSGNQINVNGTIVGGLRASLIVIGACASCGLALGLIAWLLMRALGEAAGGSK